MTGIALKGTDLDLKLDGSIVATATDWSLSPSREMIEVTTMGSGKGKIYIPDRTDYTISLNGLFFRGESASQVGYLEIVNKLMNADSSTSWTATLDGSTGSFASGWGYLTSAPIQVAQGSAISYSAELQGCGGVTINTAFK